MNNRFIAHNLFWNSKEEFFENDKHISDLKKLKYVHYYSWLEEFNQPAVHVVSGPRQIGKTTALKQFIKKLLLDGVGGERIFFLACDNLIDRQDLYSSIVSFLPEDKEKQAYVFIDEATFVEQWELSIKALIDEGRFKNCLVVITGSDSIILENASNSFPGIERRGKNAKDIQASTLSFKDFVKLVSGGKSLDDKTLQELFLNYLQCGGFLTAINQLFTSGNVDPSLYSVYQQWIYSDFIRKGKSQRKLTDLLSVLYPRISSQVSFSELARKSQELSTDTLIDYIEHLERLGVIRVLYAIEPNKKKAAPKKSKKILFRDPLYSKIVFSILKHYELVGDKEYLETSVLVEGVISEFFASSFPVFYHKGRQEIDLVALNKGKVFPVEVKWQKEIHANKVKELKKYDRNLILWKNMFSGEVSGVPAMSLVNALMQEPSDLF